jgi:cell division protein FtsQ
LTFGALCTLAGAAVMIVPFDLLHRIDFSRVFESKATALLVAAGFGIDQVSITGQRFASDNDIYEALDLTNVRTFAEFDSEAALKRIDRIPWVESAQITRVYPSSLDIVIRERTPAVLWTRGSRNYLVDATGRVLGPAPQAVQWDLPRIAGEGAAEAAASMFAAVRHYPAIEREYAYGERVGERRWRIVLKNGTMLDLASDREVEGLGEIANSPMVAPAIAGAPMIVDVRTPGRITMRPAQDKPAKTAALDAPLPSGQQLRVSDDR